MSDWLPACILQHWKNNIKVYKHGKRNIVPWFRIEKWQHFPCIRDWGHGHIECWTLDLSGRFKLLGFKEKSSRMGKVYKKPCKECYFWRHPNVSLHSSLENPFGLGWFECWLTMKSWGLLLAFVNSIIIISHNMIMIIRTLPTTYYQLPPPTAYYLTTTITYYY